MALTLSYMGFVMTLTSDQWLSLIRVGVKAALVSSLKQALTSLKTANHKTETWESSDDVKSGALRCSHCSSLGSLEQPPRLLCSKCSFWHRFCINTGLCFLVFISTVSKNKPFWYLICATWVWWNRLKVVYAALFRNVYILILVPLAAYLF